MALQRQQHLFSQVIISSERGSHKQSFRTRICMSSRGFKGTAKVVFLTESLARQFKLFSLQKHSCGIYQ